MAIVMRKVCGIPLTPEGGEYPAAKFMKESAMMTQRQTLTLSLAGTALLGLLSAIYLVASKRKTKSERSNSVVKHSVGKPANDVLKHWTADKMRAAQPVELPNVSAIKPNKQRSPRSRRTAHSEQE